MTPPAPSRNGPSIGQAIVLFLAGALLLSTACFGMFGLEKGIPSDLQGLVFLPLLFVALGMMVALVAFFAALGRRFTRTVPAGAASPEGEAPPPAAAGPEPGASVPSPTSASGALSAAPMGRPSFGQALALVGAGCVLFLSLCAGVYDGMGGRAGWVAGPVLLVLFAAAVYGFGVMTLRVLQSFGGGQPPATPPGGPSRPA